MTAEIPWGQWLLKMAHDLQTAMRTHWCPKEILIKICKFLIGTVTGDLKVLGHLDPQIAKFMGTRRGPPGSCWPQMGPKLAPTCYQGGYCGGQLRVLLLNGPPFFVFVVLPFRSRYSPVLLRFALQGRVRQHPEVALLRPCDLHHAGPR